MKHRFPYQWTLNNTHFTKDKGKVFSCFACGGGSTMGYKLAGFDVIGMNEIDPKMAECYITNHNPKYSFIEDIRVFKDRDDLPEELYHLDILDGSPPCSSFSMAGNREKDWGKEKKFREGQSEQVLDTLFFDFISLAKKLQPKVAIAENVKGILLGDAKEYVKRILTEFDEAGYVVKEFLLNAMRMGIPQKRERVFFVAIRKDLIEHLPVNHAILFDDFPILDLVFFEPLVTFGEVYEDYDDGQYVIPPSYLEAWKLRQYGDNDLSCTMGREFNRPNSFFSSNYIYKDKVPNTITGGEKNILFDEPRGFNKNELCKIGSFPLDYNFLSNKPAYLIGMSVPPVMMAQIALRIYEQWLIKI